MVSAHGGDMVMELCAALQAWLGRESAIALKVAERAEANSQQQHYAMGKRRALIDCSEKLMSIIDDKVASFGQAAD